MKRACSFLLASILLSSTAAADEPIERLVDKLIEVSEPGFGYSGYFAGSEFLPYDDTGEVGTLVLGAAQRARSETLRAIVEKGVDAVPVLLTHIGDERKVKMKPMSGMMWMSFADEYDWNRRTRPKSPAGVNRDDWPGGQDQRRQHAVTVGDLCFVALGQIVNRNFSATRYQPTGGLVVNSPSYSKRLREVIVADWTGLTREQHKQLLIEDFKTPDHAGRRTGAYLRLAFFYPETVEPLVLAELAKPTFDVFKVAGFCRDRLYKTANKGRRQQLYDQFIREHGAASSAGIMQQLFDDLDNLEANEQGRLHPRLTEYSTQPRELLIQLFGKPANVKSADRPFFDPVNESQRARLIRTLTHDQSRKIGEAVKQIFLNNKQDDYLAPACLACLANRGFGPFLAEQLGAINVADTKTNHLHLEYLRAGSTSREKVVQDKLRDILTATSNDDYFMAALAGLDKTAGLNNAAGLAKFDSELVLQQATKILNGLPADTTQGEAMLAMIGQRFPDQAKRVFKDFLARGSAQRAETMCRVLWNGHPLSKEILGPLLDDKRFLSGFSEPMRVCDRAAQAISHVSREIKFDSDWPQKRRDEVIKVLKEYCRKATK